MAAPDFKDRVIEPPRPDMDPDDLYLFIYDLWSRTGGYETYIVNLNGLEASVQELNTLVGIDTNTTVQAQLNLKFNTADAGTMAYQNANNVAITGGALSGVTITNSNVSGVLKVKIGAASTLSTCGVSLFTNAGTAANVDNTENNLMTYTLAANSLNAAGVYLDIEVWGTYAANANNKRIRLYFGSQVIFDTSVIAANAGNWYIKAKVMAEASADQKSIATIISSNTLVTPTAQINNLSQDETTPIVIKTTALAVAANDVIQTGFSIKWFAAV